MLPFAEDVPVLPTTWPQILGVSGFGIGCAGIAYIGLRWGPMFFRFILDYAKQSSAAGDERKASDNRFYLEGFNRADVQRTDELNRAYRLLDEMQSVNDQYAARLENCKVNDAAREAVARLAVENQKRLAKIVTDLGRDPGQLVEMPARIEIDDETLKHRALNVGQSVQYAKAVTDAKSGSKTT